MVLFGGVSATLPVSVNGLDSVAPRAGDSITIFWGGGTGVSVGMAKRAASGETGSGTGDDLAAAPGVLVAADGDGTFAGTAASTGAQAATRAPMMITNQPRLQRRVFAGVVPAGPLTAGNVAGRRSKHPKRVGFGCLLV
jgi:hypothetical protein